jgi:hypothetical protein
MLLKQQSAGRHVTPFGHTILILSQPVFAFSPYFYVLSREAILSVYKPLVIFRFAREAACVVCYNEDQCCLAFLAH